MLQLQQTCTGFPAAGVQHLILQQEAFLVCSLFFLFYRLFIDIQPVVCIRRCCHNPQCTYFGTCTRPCVLGSIPRDYALQGFYYLYIYWFRYEISASVPSLLPLRDVYTISKIVAAMNTRVAAWSISGTQQDTWRIHSTLVLPDTHIITTLDNKAGMIFRCRKDASLTFFRPSCCRFRERTFCVYLGTWKWPSNLVQKVDGVVSETFHGQFNLSSPNIIVLRRPSYRILLPHSHSLQLQQMYAIIQSQC